MSKRKKYTGKRGQDSLHDALKSTPALSAFTFDGPYEVSRMDLLDNMSCADNGRYFDTPMDWNAIARASRRASWHQSALYFKRNALNGCFVPHPLLSRQAFSAFALDWFVFGNAYLEVRRNRLGEPLLLRPALAKYTRRGSDLDTYWYLYYDNGSHAGCIIYVGTSQANAESVEAIKKTLTDSRGRGAFKNLFLHAPGGGKDGVQILPFQQITAKDEFLNIKGSARDDILAAHRVPPQLMGAMPDGNAAFGDVEKAARVFFINELQPVMEAMKHVNEWLGVEVMRFNPYALLLDNAS